MDYHHWKSPSSPWSRMLIPHSILPNHTEGHRLNGRDALSRKAGLRLGKDSTGVGVKNLLSCDSNLQPLDNQSHALTPPPRSALLSPAILQCCRFCITDLPLNSSLFIPKSV
jgi:hypothetical protein